jgi:chromosome segregation ATPase
MRVVAQDSARVTEERRELEQRRSRALLDAVGAEQARESAADSVIQASGLLADLRREAETESESLAAQRAAAAAAAERRRSTTAELRRLEAELAEVKARLDRHNFDLSEMSERAGELTKSIAELTIKAGSVEAERAAEENQIAELSTRLQQARQQADVFAAELSDLNRRAARCATQDLVLKCSELKHRRGKRSFTRTVNQSWGSRLRILRAK